MPLAGSRMALLPGGEGEGSQGWRLAPGVHCSNREGGWRRGLDIERYSSPWHR